MKTKVIAFTFALLSGALISNAQSSSTATMGKTTFGVRAGVNFQNLNGEGLDGKNLKNKLKTGFNIGVNAEVPIAPEFYIQPGLLFTTKGAKIDANNDPRVNISYLELPVNFLYKPVLGTGKLLLGFGPYAGYALGGNWKADNSSQDIDLEFDSELKSSEVFAKYGYTIRRFDFGANFLAGYEFSQKISVQLNAQLGLTNISPDAEGFEDAKTKNTGFGVSVGYRF